MTDYREVLRLHNLGLNHSKIAASAGISRPTVIKILRCAESQGLSWQTTEGLSDRELGERLYPKEEGKPSYKLPYYTWVHRELTKPGVTLQLLWFEYCEKCRENDEIPYQLTQFKKYYYHYLLSWGGGNCIYFVCVKYTVSTQTQRACHPLICAVRVSGKMKVQSVAVKNAEW